MTLQSATLATGPMPQASEFYPGPVESHGPLARLASGFFGQFLHMCAHFFQSFIVAIYYEAVGCSFKASALAGS